eukprot:m.272226 g.272226  ORF g.272226 m.272226 type:complete len:84 (-) comp17676_c1_seq2:2335-2586(-)
MQSTFLNKRFVTATCVSSLSSFEPKRALSRTNEKLLFSGNEAVSSAGTTFGKLTSSFPRSFISSVPCQRALKAVPCLLSPTIT